MLSSSRKRITGDFIGFSTEIENNLESNISCRDRNLSKLERWMRRQLHRVEADGEVQNKAVCFLKKKLFKEINLVLSAI